MIIVDRRSDSGPVVWLTSEDAGETWLLRFLLAWASTFFVPGVWDSVSAIENFLALLRRSSEVDKTLQWLSEGSILRPGLLVLAPGAPYTSLWPSGHCFPGNACLNGVEYVVSPVSISICLLTEAKKAWKEGKGREEVLASIRKEEYWDLIGNLGPASLDCRRELRDGTKGRSLIMILNPSTYSVLC